MHFRLIFRENLVYSTQGNGQCFGMSYKGLIHLEYTLDKCVKYPMQINASYKSQNLLNHSINFAYRTTGIYYQLPL